MTGGNCTDTYTFINGTDDEPTVILLPEVIEDDETHCIKWMKPEENAFYNGNMTMESGLGNTILDLDVNMTEPVNFSKFLSPT